MAKDASIRAFKCPTCGAPLEPEAGSFTMKCPYCNSTVIIPESLRSPSSSTGPSMGDVFQFGLNGIDLNQIVGNAMHLPQAISLAQQGKIDEAAQIYSQITGMNLEDATKSIRDLAAGRAVSLTPGQANVTWQPVQTSFSRPAEPISTPSDSPVGSTISTSRRGCRGLVVAGISIGIVLLIALGAVGYFLFSRSQSGGGPAISGPLLPPSFAGQTLSFGSKGIGPGMFTDARAVAVEPNGDIVVGDYQDGRIQIFDPTGKFVSTFSLGQKVSIDALAVSRDGRIYAVHQGKISIFDSSGKSLKTIQDQERYFDDLTLGPDGTLYAITEDDTIVHYNSDGKINLEIKKAFENVTGEPDTIQHIAVDGLGNIYIVGANNYLVLKYSPQGKYLDQFGGEADSAADFQPGKFVEPSDIIIDGYGRVYVTDVFSNVQVFDSSGTYLNSINVEAYGIALDDQNNAYVTFGDHVEKFQVQKPANQ